MLIGRDGRETPIDDSGAPITQADALIGVVLVFRDIADRQRAEAALRESEACLRTVTERAQVGLVIVNPQHRYVGYANRAYADIFHLPMGVIVGQRADVLSPVYEAQIRPRPDRAFQGERVIYELAFPAVAPTLQERYYTVTYEPGLYNSETVVIVVVVEITEHKRAEQQLQYQATLLGQVSDAIISTDTRFVIRSWNPAAEALYGWPAHDVIDRLMGRSCRPRTSTAMRSARARPWPSRAPARRGGTAASRWHAAHDPEQR